MATIAVTRYAVEAIPLAVAEHVRAEGRDPTWGHSAQTETATGFGPCRLCLRTFREGEERRTLFTYDSHHGVAPFPQPGPVYIHAEPCDRWEGEGFPPELSPLELTFEAVAPGPRIVALERSTGAHAEASIARLLELPEVECLNVRNTRAGCFVARVERR